ncbi:aminotransferase class III-fold pyridoxal phosphate-dependent enzyme [Streptomyces sp. DT2A-34]|uniref:aminotransferase family protein n=1 Tax=Streptomyces sp. DT2A-34 TaxID=3051182 RepID=UPI00265BFCF5|nr:aminotransferase class III-fold pyridoxal phosphate-dependent enzyme [Streptomyces sp. DT2A-34]MDO0916650.1 aminotransferase class III-fold pyridoxal phosphate-dependent enzyme [Streptomyces sp. DT2A-34]
MRQNSATAQTLGSSTPIGAVSAETRPDAWQRTNGAVLQRDLRHAYKTIVSAEGMYLFDSEGRPYMDAVGGAAVNIIGHGVGRVSEALAAASASTSFVYSAVFTNPWQERLAESLSALAPVDDGKVFFCSGGSEANESAVKIARQYHLDRGRATKWKIISRGMSYHGNTLSMLGLSGRPSWSSRYSPYIASSPRIAPAFCYRCPFSAEFPGCGTPCADDLERSILQEGPETVAAFIAEPVSGTSLAGAVPVAGYYERIREICDRYDILFIADEVLTGYGRTGKPFAIEHWDAKPDILTVGKGLGSGYAPLAACVASGRIVETIRSTSGQYVHGFTYGGMPMACAVGVQVYEIVEENELFDRSAEMGEHLHHRLRELAGRRDEVGDVRGIGLLAGVELVADKKTKRPFDKDHNIAKRVVEVAETRGVLLREGTPGVNHGSGGDQIQISPPYIITREEIDELVTVLDESIGAVLHG